MPSSNTAKSEELSPETYFESESVTTTLRATRSTPLRKVVDGTEVVAADAAVVVDGDDARSVGAVLAVSVLTACGSCRVCACAPTVAATRAPARSRIDRCTTNPPDRPCNGLFTFVQTVCPMRCGRYI